MAVQEYGGPEHKNLFIVRAGSPEEMELPWPKVQRRIAQLIKEDRFFTEAERDNLDDIDPIAIRENLAQRGIVNGQVTEPEKLDNAPLFSRSWLMWSRLPPMKQNRAFPLL